LSENETNVLPNKQIKLKGMDDVTKNPQEDSNAVGSIANRAPSYQFDPSKEPLLRDNPRRFVVFPIEYPDIWQMYKKVCLQFFSISSSLKNISSLNMFNIELFSTLYRLKHHFGMLRKLTYRKI
jgi:hypothetical protein